MKTFLLLLASFSLALPGSAAILPGVIGPWKLVSTAPLPVSSNRPLWDEYGLQDSEQGVYQKAGGTLKVEAWRVADSTASMAVFDFLRPADAKPAPTFDELTPEAALTPNGALVALGNYLVRFGGPVPEADAVANMFRSMARYEHSSLPTFNSYLPARAVPNSERYIGGPVALKEFFPGVDPSVAGFHLGGEAAVADYKSGLRMALFSYPMPSIARDREAALSKIPGAIVKRTGPMVAVILHPSDANVAENLISQVRYQATVTTGQKPATPRDNPGNLMLNIFYLILILFGFCVASGVLFGVFRMIFRRSGPGDEGEEILALHLEGR